MPSVHLVATVPFFVCPDSFLEIYVRVRYGIGMNRRLLDPALLPILDKVEAGERLSGEEGLTLYASLDLNGIGSLANIVRERKNGNVATYVFNRYINYSNLCILNCQFCAFSAKKRDPHAFEMAIPEIASKTKEAWEGFIRPCRPSGISICWEQCARRPRASI